MGDKKTTAEMQAEKEEELNKKPETSQNPDDYWREKDPETKEPIGEVLVCRTCAGEVELYECSCGKFGPMEHIQEHIKNRHAKKTQAAIKGHRLVKGHPWPGAPMPIVEDKPAPEPAKKSVVEKVKDRVKG